VLWIIFPICPDVEATRADLCSWLANNLRYHRFSWAAAVCAASLT
jgi:hypothetical protein